MGLFGSFGGRFAGSAGSLARGVAGGVGRDGRNSPRCAEPAPPPPALVLRPLSFAAAIKAARRVFKSGVVPAFQAANKAAAGTDPSSNFWSCLRSMDKSIASGGACALSVSTVKCISRARR